MKSFISTVTSDEMILAACVFAAMVFMFFFGE